MKPSMLSNAERRLQVTAAEPHWRIKFILRIVIMLFDFISIVVTASMPNLYGLVLVMNYIPLGISFFWCLANVVVRARRPRPMHPGANVAMDLLIWMGFTVALVFDWWQIDFYDKERDSYYTDYYYGGTFRRVVSMLKAACVFATFSTVLHIALFIWASINTSKRNKAEIEARRIAIVEKLEADRAYSERASSFEPNSGLHTPSNFGMRRASEPDRSYSSIDLGSRSLGQPVSPPDSPGPSSPAPAYIYTPNSPYAEHKAELE